MLIPQGEIGAGLVAERCIALGERRACRRTQYAQAVTAKKEEQ